jgi:hypothetical protein
MRTKRAGPEEWRSYFCSLERTEGCPSEPEGYLTALATCYRAYKREFALADVVFPVGGTDRDCFRSRNPS